MSTPVEFVFVLLGVISFVIAASGRVAWGGFIALGLALVYFPVLWNLGEAL